MTRKLIKEYKGWPGISVEYLITYNNGKIQHCICSKDEWIEMESRDKLLTAGADPTILDMYRDAIRNVAIEDNWMAEAGEDL